MELIGEEDLDNVVKYRHLNKEKKWNECQVENSFLSSIFSGAWTPTFCEFTRKMCKFHENEHTTGVPMWPLPMMPWTSLCRHRTLLGHQTGHYTTLAQLLLTYGGHHWRPVETYSLEHPYPSPPHVSWYWDLVTIEAHTVGNQAVRILRNCFLVWKKILKILKFLFYIQKVFHWNCSKYGLNCSRHAWSNDK